MSPIRPQGSHTILRHALAQRHQNLDPPSYHVYKGAICNMGKQSKELFMARVRQMFWFVLSLSLPLSLLQNN